MAPRLFTLLTATATPLQATTYLLGIALASITFLVFLNSSISFVVTDIIGQREHVGTDVGTLGFADELLALVACPLWGLLSDRVGVRAVAVTGYVVIGVSLVGLVQSGNVFPQLLLGRLGFSLGGAACSTMVTAGLPAMLAQREDSGDEEGGGKVEDGPIGGAGSDADAEGDGHAVSGPAARLRDEERPSRRSSVGHGPSPSVSSELTITQTRYTSQSRSRSHNTETSPDSPSSSSSPDSAASSSQLAGLVGLFTGAGALVALLLLLPLPTYFQNHGQARAQSLQTTFYTVAALAFITALFTLFGLRHLPGEANKTPTALFRRPYDESTHIDAHGHVHTTLTPSPSYLRLLTSSLALALHDPTITLAYLGGFVARASSVAISLFIPLYINAYFIRTGLCPPTNHPTAPDLKASCQRAYTLSATLTGLAETTALIAAPLFGYLGTKTRKHSPEYPLLAAALLGTAGYALFAFLPSPDAFRDPDARWAFLAVILIGLSQIGCIVCSLSLLSQSVNQDPSPTKTPSKPAAANLESTPLLPQTHTSSSRSIIQPPIPRRKLKGTLAGLYSFSGGAGILLLTKVGGLLFDRWRVGAPFFLLAGFCALLGVGVGVVGLVAVRRGRGVRGSEGGDGEGG
ncbi:hypothetical protein B0A50_01483 [Salinomyces thailandicus]|uniref:MFS transporter n=1 Tax=Salinomyces thailandicus TaxID=706561 RepID=A0A4U0UB32_9PEZI|nr:hypothetical protein B0A50_01483 [Salinomyces thailandica]